jgi:hypothetical protein
VLSWRKNTAFTDRIFAAVNILAEKPKKEDRKSRKEQKNERADIT